MSKIENIQSVNDAEAELIRRQSHLLLQKRSESFGGELKTSGSIVENYVKEKLKQHIPSGYRVCSGYIATTETISNTENLIQHDMIIVDNRIPALYKFGVGDIEIVSAESVCGIIEIKRTLTKRSLNDAITHLSKTYNILEEYRDGIRSKVNAINNAAGPTLSIATRAPLYGIIGLEASKKSINEKFVIDVITPEIHKFIDIIWAPSSGFLLRFAIKRTSDDNVFIPKNVSRNVDEGFLNHSESDYFDQKGIGRTYRMAVSNLRIWINNTSGDRLQPEENLKYFGF